MLDAKTEPTKVNVESDIAAVDGKPSAPWRNG